MSVCEEDIVNWKKLWQLTSGTAHDISMSIVEEKLFEVTKELQNGILFYKKCSSSSSDLEKFLKKKKQHKLFQFTDKLQQLLDLDLHQLWAILCFYLLNEYRGSAYSLTQYISVENMSKLLDDIWGFYSMERITLLKIVKNLLEFCQDNDHPYHNIYKNVSLKIKVKNLLKSYIEQLEYLINESPPPKLLSGEFFNYQIRLIAWSERKMREINEILQIIILCLNYTSIEPEDVHKLLTCFRLHGFGSQQRYIDHQNNDYHRDLITKVAYNEVILFMRCLDISPNAVSDHNEEWILKLVELLDKPIASLQNNTENAPIFLAWMLFNYQLDSVLNDENALRTYRQFGIKAIKLNVFVFLKDLLSHQMFQTKSLIANIARETIYNILSCTSHLFNGDGSISQHAGVYELFSELISWSDIADNFIAQMSNDKDSGVQSLYKFALEYFPVDFIHLSDIFYSLLKAGKEDFINSQLQELSTFATIYDDQKFHLKPSNQNDDEFILMHNYTPFPDIKSFQIAESTAAIITRNLYNNQQQIIHFRKSYNYFTVLRSEMNSLLNETFTNFELNETRLKRINSGIKVLSIITEIHDEIHDEIVQPIEMCIDILLKFKNIQQPPIELFANCLEVFTGLLSLFSNEILTRIININLLPYLTCENLDYKKYANGVAFDSSLIGSYLINIEKKLGKYDFLLAYLNFLRECLMLKRNELFQIEIPGLIFLLREILPHIHSWRFRNPNDKNKILIEVMNCICEILDKTTAYASGRGDEDSLKIIHAQKIMRNICVYSILNLDNGIVLLRFIAVGNAFLQTIMENESNWVSKQPHTIIFLVRLSMRILMQTLKLKTTIFESTTLSPLESLIYTQPKQRDTLRIIPMITSYMNNIFDRWLPILSCRLLRRIALEFNMSLLACLDMEPDHIRLIFLQRLPDDLENDDLKCAILEFIEACILKQPGLTEAFFKLNVAEEKEKLLKRQNGEAVGGKRKAVDKRKDDQKIEDENQDVAQKRQEEEKQFMKSLLTASNVDANDTAAGYSILTFMNDYLINVKNDPYIIEHSLHSRIMSIYHALWRNNMQILAWDLINQSNFWSSILNPLFCDELYTKERAYSQLFNILSLELFTSIYHDSYLNQNNNSLKTIIQRFFQKEHFNKWINYIFDLPKIQDSNDLLYNMANSDNCLMITILSDETPDWLVLLQSFKEFIIITLKKNNSSTQQQNIIELPEENLIQLSRKCLNALVEHINEQQNIPIIDLRSFIILSELYLYILLNLKTTTSTPNDDDDENQRQLKQIIKLLSNLIPIYDNLPSRAREALLSIIMRILDLLAIDLIQDIIIATNCLQLIIDIVSFELCKLEKSIKNEMDQAKLNPEDDYCENTVILSLNLLKSIAIIFQNDHSPNNWNTPIKSHRIIIRLLDCAQCTLHNYSKYKLSIELLDVLISFAKCYSCSDEFLYCGIADYLWLKLIPPRELLQSTIPSSFSYNLDDYNSYQMQFELSQDQQQPQQKPIQNTWLIQDWWPIYQKGVELITILFQNNKKQFLNDILIFIGVHEEYLIDAILLSKQSLEDNCMALVKTTLYFLTEAFTYQEEWKLKHSQSLFNLVKCVQVLLDHSISLLYRPRILKRFVEKGNVQQQPVSTTPVESSTFSVDSLIQPMNDLIELIILCTKCLLQFSPTLLQLICEPEFLSSKWESLIEIQFGAPKFNISSHPQLTFGTVLGVVTILTKAINLQNYEFHEVPLNIIPQVKNQKFKSTGAAPLSQQSTSASQLDPIQDRSMMRSSRSPLKSISVASSISLSSISNEILSNLDSELCLAALEYILTLLASQSLLALKSELLSNREKQLIRREISNELVLFHDCVRKKIFMDHRSIWQRKKHGIVMMMDLEDDDDDDNNGDENLKNKDRNEQAGPSSQNGKSSKMSAKDSMRINVVRRLHLSKQKSKDNEDQSMSLEMSPISMTSGISSRKPISSTPLVSSSLHRELVQNYHDDIENEEFNYFISDEEPSYSPLSYVQLVEEDYLHFLSNLFHVICSVD